MPAIARLDRAGYECAFRDARNEKNRWETRTRVVTGVFIKYVWSMGETGSYGLAVDQPRETNKAKKKMIDEVTGTTTAAAASR